MRRGGAAAGNNAPTRLLLQPAAKGSTPFPARLPPSLPLPPEQHRHRARPSQLRGPETRKPPPSTLLLAPEDRRGAGRASTEGDGNCCRAKMSPWCPSGTRERGGGATFATEQVTAFHKGTSAAVSWTPSPAHTHLRRHARTFFTHIHTPPRASTLRSTIASPRSVWAALGELPGGRSGVF
ncbi:hypothetical protein NN561_008588 [Cricetulus griseus]